MKLQYGKVFILTERISNFFFLNLLWLVMCLPVITIIPSTTALFGVIRDWVLKKESSFLRLFFKKFKENLKQSMVLQGAWLFYGLVVYSNTRVINNFEDGFQTAVLSFLILVGILLFLLSLYMMILMVHFNLPLPALWKNSFLMALTFLPTNILAIGMILLMASVSYYFPIALTFAFSITAFLVFKVIFSKIAMT